MKKNVVTVSILLTLFFCQVSLASSFFNIAVSGPVLSISSALPSHTYPSAGIKINTSKYSINSGCIPNANGYCIFSVNSTTPANIVVNGPTGSINATLCLNGQGPLSCQNYNLPIVTTTAYIVNAGNNTVSICPVSHDGSLDHCNVFTGNGTFNDPLSIAINNAGTIAYIANFTNTISICPINSNGSFGICTATTGSGPGAFNTSTGTALSPSGAYLYVTNFNSGNGDGSVSICPIQGDGMLGICNTATNGSGNFAYPQAVTVNAAGTYIYVPGSANVISLSICALNANTGAIGSCELATGSGPAPNPGFLIPEGLSFNAAESFAYIGNVGNSGSLDNFVSICPVHNDGTFGSCTITDGNDINGDATFNFSADQEINLFMGSASHYGYIPNDGNNTVSICPINSDGSLGICTTSDGNQTFNQPAAIALTSSE